MGDISTWSPVDESNTAAPPNGWPEGMAVNAVNNCARAMQGAVRRWYDTVTAQLASLTASLANYLPLSGGVTSGNITSPNLLVTGGYYIKNANTDVVLAQRIGDGHIIADGGGAPALLLNTSGSYYRNGSHTFQNESAALLAAVDAAGNFTAIGNVTGNVAVNTVSYKVSGVMFAQRSVDNAHHIFDAAGELALALFSNANYYRADNHNFQNNAGSQIASIGSTGAFAAQTVSANTVTGNTVTSNGGISAVGTISGNLVTGNTVNSNGAMVAGGNLSAANLGTQGNLTVNGGGNVVGVLTAGTMSSNQIIATNLDAADIDCTGNIDAASYTRGGVPMVMLSQQQFDRIEARLAALEIVAMREPA